MYIINDKGQVYYNSGTADRVSIGNFDLTNCHVLHNHPVENGIVSFGEDDFYLIRNNPSAKWYLVNEQYEYRLEVLKKIDLSHNQVYLGALGLKSEFQDESDVQHLFMEYLVKKGYIRYDRKKRKQ